MVPLDGLSLIHISFTGASIALLCNAFFDWDVSVVSFTLVGMEMCIRDRKNATIKNQNNSKSTALTHNSEIFESLTSR